MIWHHDWLKYNKENGYLERRHILWVFWNNKHITEPCEKWLCCDGNYICTRLEELRTYSGEVFFTNEYKATLSEKDSRTYVGIDDPKIFRDLHSEETILRTKKEYKDMLDKVNNKISKINGVNKMREKVRKKIELNWYISQCLNYMMIHG